VSRIERGSQAAGAGTLERLFGALGWQLRIGLEEIDAQPGLAVAERDLDDLAQWIFTVPHASRWNPYLGTSTPVSIGIRAGPVRCAGGSPWATCASGPGAARQRLTS
jgi:hypothetical protein